MLTEKQIQKDNTIAQLTTIGAALFLLWFFITIASFTGCTITKDGIAVGGIQQSRVLLDIAKLEAKRDNKKELDN